MLRLAFDFDPMEKCRGWFAGDWESYARAADVWANLAKFCGSLATTVESGNRTAGRSWDGQAADAADLYFTSLCGKLRDLQDSLVLLHKEYMTVTYAVLAAAEGAGQLLGLIGDQAATAALSWVAGAATAWSGWGAAAAMAMVAAEIVRMCEMWDKIMKRVNALQLAINVVGGNLVGLGAEVAASLTSFTLPRAAYAHPAV
ncbi:hypothetical protein ACFQ2B_24445 [Streptomyces stramineus]